MKSFKLDICEIRQAALEWKAGRKPSLREFLNHRGGLGAGQRLHRDEYSVE
jgi:hypothetical protein